MTDKPLAEPSPKSPEKKKYVAPTVTRVELNPSQTLLSACNTATISTTATKTGSKCGPACRKHGPAGGSLAAC